jgi:dUTP pyrophosphatase
MSLIMVLCLAVAEVAKLQGYNMNINIELLLDAKLPTKSYENDGGWDLYANEDTLINPGRRAIVRTGIKMEIPNGYVGLIWPRSGLSVKKGIDILAGVIDASYRGEIMVCLLNTDVDFDVRISKGDRIAQILFQEVPLVQMVKVNHLENTLRGEGGFGSTGN